MPSGQTDTHVRSSAFEFKSGPVNLPILKLLTHEIEPIAAQLREKISRSPDFFRDAPLAIDLHYVALSGADVDFLHLVKTMRGLGLVPVGICGGSDLHNQSARAAGLFQLTMLRHEISSRQGSSGKSAAAIRSGAQNEAPVNKLIEHPVRSGQRIYAAGGDLVVLAQVSAGAEIMADGNIHVYGVLRGRALAGVQGNLSSRIFCHDLQAELVSIGGHYKISENIDDSVRGVPVQIYLKDDSLIIEKT